MSNPQSSQLEDDASRETHSQFSLLNNSRFAAFFWTQFLGAFNDNVFKSALLIFFAFSVGSTNWSSGIDVNLINNLAAGLFILPFFLFSAFAGEIADKYEKSFLIRRIKLMEIVIMLCAAIAFYLKSTYGLLLVLFLMGGQSTFFGPIKYSIIPQHLKKDELVGGNALVESGTFLAILSGTITGGIVSKLDNAPQWISLLIILIACLGYLSSRRIPLAQASKQDLKLNLNPIKQTWQTIKLSREKHIVFISILGISWFWFLGASYLTQLPNFTKQVLHGDETVVTLLLASFSIGIAMGSLLCEKLSDSKIEPGLVPLGIIGLCFFGADLFVSQQGAQVMVSNNYQTFFSQPLNIRVLLDFIGIGTFGGLYIVPLYALVQSHSKETHRARIIAALNIINALFMVLSAIFGIIILGVLKFSLTEFFLIIAILNLPVALLIFWAVPEFIMNFLIWLITHSLFRISHQGFKNIPDQGPAILVCNSSRFLDALILARVCRRPIRFVLPDRLYNRPVLNFIFRIGKVIIVEPEQKCSVNNQRLIAELSSVLNSGELICFFSAEEFSRMWGRNSLKKVVESLVSQFKATVISVEMNNGYDRGLWGDQEPRNQFSSLNHPPRKIFESVQIIANLLEIKTSRVPEK